MNQQSSERKIYLLFSTPKKFNIFSWIIKKRLGTGYSHVAAAIYVPPTKRWRIYHASKGKVHSIIAENFHEKNNIIKHCVVPYSDPEQYWKSVDFLDMQTGKSYSESGAIASTFKFLRFLGIGKDGDHEFMCSEYMARMLEEGKGFSYGALRDTADYVDPKIFEKLLDGQGYNIIDCKINLSEGKETCTDC